MSFGRNLNTLTGEWASIFLPLKDEKLRSVNLDKERNLLFTLASGKTVKYGAEGDCCSHSWIEHLEKPRTVRGRTVVAVADGEGVPHDGHKCVPNDKDEDGYSYGNKKCNHESLAVYNTKLQLDNGETITIEYRNDSNGYYGGYLVLLEVHLPEED